MARPRSSRSPPGAPLGVGGAAFTTITFPAAQGSRLVLYTDGLVETRDDPIDERLQALCQLLDGPRRSREDTCEDLLRALRQPDDPDDVLLLIADLKPGEAPLLHAFEPNM
ncbi:SpoIIE family protein phosphatase [Actinomadura sp. ATCC 39365]